MSKYLLLLLLAGCATEIKKESTVKQVTCVGFCSVTEIDENIEIDESIERAEDMMLENTQDATGRARKEVGDGRFERKF